MKNIGIKRLKELYLVEHYKDCPNIPPQCRFAPSFTDKTANGLTKCIITFLKLLLWQCERINTMGRPIDNTRVVTDCLGFKRRIGSVTWIPSGATKGSADISSTIAGRSIKIEVKMKDRQSEAQRKYQEDVEAAGGVYIIVRTFDEFLTWYDKFIEEVGHGK